MIIDAVYSLQANYDSIVVPLLKRYCAAAPGLDWEVAASGIGVEHDARAMRAFVTSLSEEQRAKVFNRQIGPGTAKNGAKGRLKSQIILDIAAILEQREVVTHAAFVRAAADDPELEWKIRGGVDGVGLACWKYMLNLSGVQAAKPDSMVVGWFEGVARTGHHAAPSPAVAARLIEQATAELQARGVKVSVRQIDHLIWRKASGRALGRA